MRGDDVERLAAAVALAQQRLADHDRVERRDEGAHREPVDRRRGDDRQIAHAGQRQLQRARDRRRGQRQHMHLGAQLLELLLVRDAEMLLLVDDQQAEVLELDRLAEQRMRADDDVDLPVGEPFLRRASVRRSGPGARPARPSPASRGSARVKVLKCWRASSVVGTTTATCLPLIAATKAARSATSVLPKPTSPQTSRSIGLPEPRSSSTRVDRGQLVLGLVVGEAGAELVVEAVRDGEPRRLAQQPRGGDLDQLARHLADAVLQPRLAGLPADAAEPVELRRSSSSEP